MSIDETIIWGRYLSEYQPKYDSMDYDLRVGDGIIPDFPLPEIFKRDYQDLTRKRIDAVGYVNSYADLYEVKVRASSSALGQLLTYKILFGKSYPNYVVRQLYIICNTISDEDRAIAIAYGINVIIPKP